jgi:hypothetical protein
MQPLASSDSEKPLEVLFSEGLDTLPAPMVQALAEVDFEAGVRATVTKHHLHLDQGVALEREVVLVLLGHTQPTELLSRIETSLHIDHSQTIAVITDLQESVFKPIRASIEKHMSESTPSAPQNTMYTFNSPDMREQQTAESPAKPPPFPLDPTAYGADKTSAQRRSVAGDPYREPAV